jgi:hypothetical protein
VFRKSSWTQNRLRNPRTSLPLAFQSLIYTGHDFFRTPALFGTAAVLRGALMNCLANHQHTKYRQRRIRNTNSGVNPFTTPQKKEITGIQALIPIARALGLSVSRRAISLTTPHTSSTIYTSPIPGHKQSISSHTHKANPLRDVFLPLYRIFCENPRAWVPNMASPDMEVILRLAGFMKSIIQGQLH